MANFQELVTNGAQVNALNTDLYAWTDVSSFKWFSLQTNGVWTATISYQVSNDALNPLSGVYYTSVPGTVSFSSAFAANNIYIAPIISRYIRFRATAFTSNTSLSAILELYETPPPTIDTYAVQSGLWNIGVNAGNNTIGNVGILGLPAGAVQQNANGTATAATATATLTGVAAKFTYLTGMEITLIDTATAGSAELSLSGVVGGPLVYEINAQGTVGVEAPIIIPFNMPLQSSAVNTNIVATLPTLGASTGKVSIVLHGYTL